MAARILIIEDDAASRELVRYLLNTSGYDTLVAANGGAGLRTALQERPDLVVCDLQMPVMNGYDLVRSLLNNPLWHGAPLIAVTAFSMDSDRDKVIAAGFNDHISKPIVPETFVTQLEAFLPLALRAASPPLA